MLADVHEVHSGMIQQLSDGVPVHAWLVCVRLSALLLRVQTGPLVAQKIRALRGTIWQHLHGIFILLHGLGVLALRKKLVALRLHLLHLGSRLQYRSGSNACVLSSK